MLLKAMMYQKDQHKMFNDRADIALTLANYISCCYLSSLTVVLTANIYLAFTCARYWTKCCTCIITFNLSLRTIYIYSTRFTNEVAEL